MLPTISKFPKVLDLEVIFENPGSGLHLGHKFSKLEFEVHTTTFKYAF